MLLLMACGSRPRVEPATSVQTFERQGFCDGIRYYPERPPCDNTKQRCIGLGPTCFDFCASIVGATCV